MRAIFALIVIAALAAAAVFLVDNPGHVDIVWQGWEIGTSVGVLVGAAALAALAVVLMLWLISRILGSPRAISRRRRERRRRVGYEALTRGMVAVAAGDALEARRYARRAESLLAEPPLTLLLSAQAAQISGDELAAKKFFTAMLHRPETQFLGLRGLINQALHDGDPDTARHLAGRAVALRPNTAWATTSLFDLEARAGNWEAARAALDKASRRRFIAPDIARHHRGVIFYELSLLATASGDRHRALAQAGEAASLTPDLATPAAHHARLLLAEGRAGRAARAIERAWRTAPHPDLAQAYREIWKTDAPLAAMGRHQRLAAQNPTARESHLALVEAALAAQLWGEARNHLERALAADPPPFAAAPRSARTLALPGNSAGNGLSRATPRWCLLMARLEEGEHGDPNRMREWLDRAVRALPDPRYVCTSCGGESAEWSSRCPHCGAFDTLSWRTPAWTSAGAAPLAVVENRTLGEPSSGPQAALPAINSASG